MSEYQYYDFVAIDRPLTTAEQSQLRGISTRARITASSFTNHYEWGDLKADPRVLMERYFDAFLYLANWGTRQVILRLPTALLDPATAAEYCVGDCAESWTADDHVFLALSSEDEECDWEDDGQGHLASIVPARAELAAGDNRLLYLAWLLCVQGRELDDDEPEPPVPPGLGAHSGPLRGLADFLRLDPDLLAAASEASPPLTGRAGAPSEAALTRWVAGLPEADKDTALVRLLRGEDTRLRAELLRRFRGPVTDTAARSGRTAGELLAAAERRWAERHRAAEERRAKERARRERAAAKAREERLQTLATRKDAGWEEAAALIGTKRPKEYDTAVELLRDLGELAARDGDAEGFARRLRQLRSDHARKASLLDRLDRAGLS